jgi:branched-chain amino acid transport system ATP-binding protein
MTVLENLAMGAYMVNHRKEQQGRLAFVFELFPRLKERRNQLAGTMSGGERKMLAVARGMMSSPDLLLVDEPSLGLAPQVTRGVFKALDVLHKERGLTILLVEQNVTKTLQVTDRGYVIEKGKIVLEGKSSDLAENEHVRKVFLGI